MSIGGIGGYNPYIYDIYNNPAAATAQSEAVKDSANVVETAKSEEEVQGAQRLEIKNASLDDIQATFNKTRGRNLNLITADSKEKDIDIDKAVSNINRDAALERYRYFVDSAKKH